MNVQNLVWCSIGLVAGVVGTRLLFTVPYQQPSETAATVADADVQRLSESAHVTSVMAAKNDVTKALPLPEPQIHTVDTTSYSRDDQTLSMDDLIAENQQLHLEVAELKAQLVIKQQVPDMAETIATSLANEIRDPQFADEMEMQVKDFVYQFGFEQDIELSAVNCKSTVCEISFSAKDAAMFDERTWRKVSNKLVEAPWWNTFKATTSSSGNNQMRILATTHWPDEPKRVAQ